MAAVETIGCGYQLGNIPRFLQAFHDISTPHTLGQMCSSSVNSLLPSLRVTGSFPIGCTSVPLAALGRWYEVFIMFIQLAKYGFTGSRNIGTGVW